MTDRWSFEEVITRGGRVWGRVGLKRRGEALGVYVKKKS